MTSNGTIHLCLISAQATPNLTPLMDPSTRPAEVIFLVSKEMETRADWLEQIIRPRGIKLHRWAIDNPYDIEGIRATLEYRMNELSAFDTLVLNATGGTKPMSIAAFDVFRGLGLPIFYVHPEKDRLIWLHPKDKTPRNLADRLKLEDFLQAYGTRVKGAIDRQGLKADLQGLLILLHFH